MLLGHRYYDPSLGRFLTRDPAESDRNWYTYAGNNPLTWTDPDGLAKVEVRFREVKKVAGYTFFHAYIVVIDKRGEEYAISGGPQYDGTGHSQWWPPKFLDLGYIEMKHGPFKPGEYDYKDNPAQHQRINLVDDNLEADYWIQKFLRIGNRLTDERVTYDISGKNSNSFAHKEFDLAGIVTPKRLPVNCPAWEQDPWPTIQ